MEERVWKILMVYCLLSFFSCDLIEESEEFDFFLSEPCMLLNYEQDNRFEGTYITVKKIDWKDSSIVVDLPSNFFVSKDNCKKWNVGWGKGVPYYDAGVENIRAIRGVTSDKAKIHLGKLLRGSGYPKKGQRIVFWNSSPMNFENKIKKALVNPLLWKGFSGSSVHFGTVEYDSVSNRWILFFNECDVSKVQIYAAQSEDLIDWKPLFNGGELFNYKDFSHCWWAEGDRSLKVKQTPFISDAIQYNGKWYLFLDGYSSDGQRHIGVAYSNRIIGPYTIVEDPILSPGKSGAWNDKSVFYPKVERYKEGFVMFYDGRDSEGNECVGRATSKDLVHWKNSKKNPVIEQHFGWRSFIGSAEPNYVKIQNDSIFLMIAGVKNFKGRGEGASGNVGDAQLGVFLSVDGGNSFVPHRNNPIFVNDYSNKYENEHMGGNFCFIDTDTAEHIVYQAKSSYLGSRYNVLLRSRKKD